MIRVEGRPGLLRDVIAEVLAGSRSPRPISVLVEPSDADWAAAQGRSVVLVIDEPDAVDPLRLVRRGADAIVAASAGTEGVVAAVRRVAGGGCELPDDVLVALVSAFRHTPDNDPLSRRERQILEHIAGGASVKQTAHRLGISPKTVENLQTRLFRKLDVRNRAQALTRAHLLGLLEVA